MSKSPALCRAFFAPAYRAFILGQGSSPNFRLLSAHFLAKTWPLSHS
jgi:hypothetical protein